MPATGLLTGVFECGLTLLVVWVTHLRTASWNSALAFGVAFGCAESVTPAVPVALGGAAALVTRFRKVSSLG